MPHEFLALLKKHRAALLVFIPLVALNVWFDYHHFPLGIVLDVIIVLALFLRYSSARDKM